MSAEAESNLRGDYSKAAPDYTVSQDWRAYTEAEHALFRRLYERQSKLVPRYACPEWIEAIAGLDAAREIPRFEIVSKKLKSKTGWEIVAVPGLIPDDAFFTHLANRRFPVTVWLRKPEEFEDVQRALDTGDEADEPETTAPADAQLSLMPPGEGDQPC